MTKRLPKAHSVFEDLGFTSTEAENLRHRAVLMNAVIAELDARGLTQAAAAKLLGITQPRISDLMRGKLHLFSMDSLVVLLAALGLKVALRVRRAA